MARSDPPPDSPLLFDLPLHDTPAALGNGRVADLDRTPPQQAELDLDPQAADEWLDPGAEPDRALEVRQTIELFPAGRLIRLRAASIDVLAHLAAASIAALVGYLLGVSLTSGALPALGAFLLPFSFLYGVIPLFFFGRTLGMHGSGLQARASDGFSLTLSQAIRRWLLGLLFTALAGVPLLFVFGGRSLADRWTGSQTLRRLKTRVGSSLAPTFPPDADSHR